MAMGNAFTAVADDYESLYLNPAGLASNPLFQLRYLDLMLETSGDTISTAQTSSDAFKTFSASSLNSLMGRNLYAHGQFTPTLLMPYFGAGFISDHQIGIALKNQTIPEIDLGYQQTNGFQVGFAVPVLKGGGKRGKNREARDDLRIGIAGKMLWRRGGYQTIPISLLTRLGEKKELLSELIGGYGMGLGIDGGVQYLRKLNPAVEGSLGLAITDLGNTSFSSKAQPVYQNLSIGSSVKADFKKLVTGRFSFDLRDLTTTMDWRKRIHLGLELATPLFSIWGGANQLYPTYGVGVNLWVLRASFVSYGEELGYLKGNNPTRNYMGQLSFEIGF